MRAYYDAVLVCAERYAIIARQYGYADLVNFLSEFNRKVPLMKLNRWLGYVQGTLISRGVLTVEMERNWTRPLFRPLDFPQSGPFDYNPTSEWRS